MRWADDVIVEKAQKASPVPLADISRGIVDASNSLSSYWSERYLVSLRRMDEGASMRMDGSEIKVI